LLVIIFNIAKTLEEQMNYIKIFLTSLTVFILFFVVKPASSEIISASPVNSCIVSGSNHVEYVYIDDRLYEVTYSDDGRVLQVQPAE
jgi:hypothetical protein